MKYLDMRYLKYIIMLFMGAVIMRGGMSIMMGGGLTMGTTSGMKDCDRYNLPNRMHKESRNDRPREKKSGPKVKIEHKTTTTSRS